MLRRVQINWRRKGGKKPPNTVVVARPSKWGNPYQGEGKNPDRAMLARLFRDYMMRPEQAGKRDEARRELRGKDLACYCPLDAPCHGDVLLEIANEGGESDE